MLLSIEKKAVNEADAWKLLRQSYALPKPFGVPTLVLHPEDFESKSLRVWGMYIPFPQSIKTIRDIHKKLKAFFSAQ